MPILDIIQWVGYFRGFRALLGVFDITIMGDCYDYIAKILLSLHPCLLETLDRIF